MVNLSPDKPAVLAEAYRVLKPGGEFYFSDVYADRRVPEEAQQNEVFNYRHEGFCHLNHCSIVLIYMTAEKTLS